MSKQEDFESYQIEDEEENGERTLTLWNLVPRIMTMPASGWESTKRRGPSPDIATLRFLLPVCLLSGGSEFFTLLYQTQVEFTSILVAAVISFFSFFLGYYLTLILARLFLPKEAKFFPASKYGRLLTMTGVSTLAIFHFLYKALPMFDFFFEFLPIWTIFLVFRGMRLSDIVPEKAAFSMGVMCVVIVASPVLVEWIFTLFV